MRIRFLILVVAAVWLGAGEVRAGGAAFSNQYSQVAQAESRAVVIWDGKRETILDSLTFNVNPLVVWNFAWVIAVPSKPEVEPVKDEVYVKMEKLATRKIDKSKFWQRLLFFNSEEENAQPSQIFTRPIDIFNFEVIEPPDQLEKLNSAVRYVGYFIPKEGRPLLREYEKKGWYFVVAHVNALHIQMDATDSLTTTGAHTLPLKISFATDKPIYPIKLASIRPDVDSEAAVVSYNYGETSEKVLGEKDERVDELLSEQSKNKFPFLPLDYINLKVDLFVLADNKIAVSGLTTAYANWVKTKDIDFKDLGDKKYIDLLERNWYLTRVFGYIPISQLEDLTIEKAKNNKRVNDHWAAGIWATRKGLETTVILMKPNTFEPKTIVLKKGAKVVFKNEDSQDRWPASDPHPAHYIYGEFDPRQPIQPGKEWSFVFDKVGEWTYHDHLLSAIQGRIKIE